MRLHEHFDSVVVLDDGTGGSRARRERLAALGCTPIVLDLASPRDWPSRLRPALTQGDGAQPSAVLMLAPPQGDDREFWRPQDRLVERLECARWEIAYLGHRDGLASVPDGLRPDFIECDSIPVGLSAIAIRGPVLESVLALMPEHAVDGPLTPADWLTIAAWLSQSVMKCPRALFAWPPLERPHTMRGYPAQCA